MLTRTKNEEGEDFIVEEVIIKTVSLSSDDDSSDEEEDGDEEVDVSVVLEEERISKAILK